MTRLYIIGPMTGHEDLNKPRFQKAREVLEKCGFTGVIPHDIVQDPNTPYWVSMRKSAMALLRCDGVAHLECDASEGSTIELGLAMDYHIPVGRVSDWIKAAKKHTDYAEQAGLEYA